MRLLYLPHAINTYKICAVSGKAFESQSGMEHLWSVMQTHDDVQDLVPTSRWDIDSMYTPFIAPNRMSVTAR